MSKKWASIYANEDFISVDTFSGMRRIAFDELGKSFILSPSASPEELGTAVHDALAVSRTLAPHELAEFFDLARTNRAYEEWVSILVKRFGYAKRASLFKSMKYCAVVQSNGITTIQPSFHEKLEAWSGENINKNDYVEIAAEASFQDIGSAALLALSRCIGR